MLLKHLLPPDLAYPLLVIEWLIRIVMLFVVPLRRSPEATRSWLLLILFLPIPGIILYLAIGRPKFPAWRVARAQGLLPFYAALGDKLASAAPPTSECPSIQALGEQLGRLPPVCGNRVEFSDDYDGAIARLIEDIDGAQHHVRLLVYIFADDATGREVIAALARAVARGVRVHVLVDPVGSHHWRRGTIHRLRDAGVEVREVLPLRVLRGRTRRDMRNHRKLFLIDGTIGWAGSQNIVAKDFAKGIVNRELVARVEGPAVAEMEAIFLGDWYLETEEMLDSPDVPAPAGDATVQLLPSGADYPLEGFETLLIWQIHEARERVVMVTPYLIPDEDLIGAMRTAVLRGVTIDLVVSQVVDHPIVRLAQCSFYDDLLRSGVRIWAFRDYLLHAKSVSIDGRLAVVGSSNVDIRSFQLNEEVSLLLYDAPEIERLEAFQRGYLDNSDRIDLDAWRKRPAIRRLGENFARLVSPLL
ncbi:MAG: cardiolipin synthase [Sphingomonadaceae bacterium]|nr:cardiolipin synthase [Sphingomonadaceae bacterium]